MGPCRPASASTPERGTASPPVSSPDRRWSWRAASRRVGLRSAAAAEDAAERRDPGSRGRRERCRRRRDGGRSSRRGVAAPAASPPRSASPRVRLRARTAVSPSRRAQQTDRRTSRPDPTQCPRRNGIAPCAPYGHVFRGTATTVRRPPPPRYGRARRTAPRRIADEPPPRHPRHRGRLRRRPRVGCARGARTAPAQPPFRVLVVDHLSPSQLRHLAGRGAVGLLVPGVGATVNRRQALAAMIRGAQVNARLGGVPSGPPLLAPSFSTGTQRARRDRRDAAAARVAAGERPPLPDRRDRPRLPRPAEVADDAHRRARLDRRHRADRARPKPRQPVFHRELDAGRATREPRSPDPRQQSAEAPGSHHRRVCGRATRGDAPPGRDDCHPGGAPRERCARRGAGLERAADPGRADRGHDRRRHRPREAVHDGRAPARAHRRRARRARPFVALGPSGLR